jgi:hypothetical protein
MLRRLISSKSARLVLAANGGSLQAVGLQLFADGVYCPRLRPSVARPGPRIKQNDRKFMTSTELMRREILRLARATRHSAFISTRRLSAFYNVSEKCVLCEMAKLAEENRIRVAGWRNREDFVENSPEGLAVRVDLVE